MSSPLLPIVGTAILGLYLAHFLFQVFLGGRLASKGNAGSILVNAAAFLLSLAGWSQPTSHPAQWGASWTGIDFLNFDLLWDYTTGNMMVLVTMITLLVTIYSTAYMRGEEERQRYWAYLSLFTGSMVGLVLSGSLFTLFIFWELVGVSSWLLIGYWRTREKAAMGSFKAFVVNRAADVFFLIGICLLYKDQVATGHGMPFHLFVDQAHLQMNWGVVFLFLGAAGKSAQFPFQAWLPDAMSGPTPVSSLLHAATMVAAGVYVMLRLDHVLGPSERAIIACVGGGTALMGAISAIGQTNIKRVLAFSTVSQLGLMMYGVGAGDSGASQFHLLTHAFFKCGLFLSAGAVIHSLHHYKEHHQLDFDEEDMRNMGGLRKLMPRTFWLYVIFAASLAGIPLTSGFLSKDLLLEGSRFFRFQLDGWGLLPTLAAWATALLTPFYMARHGLLIFGGSSRLPGLDKGDRPKDPGMAMWLPMLVLAVFSTALVWEVMQLPLLFSNQQAYPGDKVIVFLHSMVFHAPAMALLSIGLAATGLGLGWMIYRRGYTSQVQNIEQGFLFRLSRKEFHWDAVYDWVVVRPGLALARMFYWTDKHLLDGAVNGLARGMVSAKENAISLSRLFWRFDTHVIDFFVNGIAQSLWQVGGRLRRLQGGKLQAYMALSILGLLLLLGAFIYFVSR